MAKKFKPRTVYSVWNNKTDEIVIIDGDARACARALGCSENSFRSIATRARKGQYNRYTVIERLLDKDDADYITAPA